MTKFIGTGFLLCMVLCSGFYFGTCDEVDKKHHPNDNKTDTCGDSYGDLSGHIQFGRKSSLLPKDKSGDCNWTISINSTLSQEKHIFLFIDEFMLNLEDELIVKDINQTTELYKVKGDKLSPFGILIDATEIVVFLISPSRPEQNQSFHMLYNTAGCHVNLTTLETTTLTSPRYSKDFKGPVKCKFHFNSNRKDQNALLGHFTSVNFTNGTIKINDQPYNKNQPEIISTELDVEMSVNNVSLAESFTFFYELTDKVCSNNIVLKELEEKDILAPSNFDSLSMNCHKTVQGPEGTIFTVDLKGITLPSATDQILILDGNSRSSPELIRITSNTANSSMDRYIISSSNNLWISMSSQNVNPNYKATIVLIPTKYGCNLKNNGNLTLNSDKSETHYAMEVSSNQQVQLIITNPSDLGSADLYFYSSFSKDSPIFATISKDSKTTNGIIVSPGNQMFVVVKNLDKDVKATFKAVDGGCFAYGSGKGGTYSVVGNCNNTCSWTIPQAASNSTETIAIHFSTLSLSKNDALTITKLDSNNTIVAKVIGNNVLPDVHVAANDGALVELKRGNCSATNEVVVFSSYVVQPACGNSVNLQMSETNFITSPNYPQLYPLNAECKWTISRPPKPDNSWLMVSFGALQLANVDHQLIISIKKLTEIVIVARFTGNDSVLPDDLLFDQDIIVEFSTSSKNTTNLKSGSGFNLTFTTIDMGQILNKTDFGNVSTPNYPKPVATGSVFAWLVQVQPMNKTTNSTIVPKNIISYHFDKATKPDVEKYLKVYDGPSIRSSEIKNESNYDLLSRTNSLLFVYSRIAETNGTETSGFMLNYTAHACNSSLMCLNGICLHESWHCNNINDCGDWSDERDCEGFAPPAPPTTPSPPTPPSAGGASTTALALGILAALLIGVVIGFGAPAALRRIRGNRFSTYSTFSNSGE